MRTNLLPLALGALLISSLSACSVNYYVGGTRYQQAPPQAGYDYDYPPSAPGTVVVVPGPTAQPPIRTAPPVRTPPPPVRNPPIRTTPGTGHGGGSGSGHSGGSGGTHQPGSGSSQPNAGGGLLPTAPPKPIPGQTTNGPTRQPVKEKDPDLLPTAPPKPIPGQAATPGPTRQPPVDQPPTKEPDLLPTAPPKPIPDQPASSGPTRQPVREKDPDLLPTAPPKPIPGQAATPQGEPVAAPANGTELLPTAPPKPIPSSSQQAPPAPEPTKEPDLLPTAPPKPAPAQSEPQGEAPAGPRRRGRVGDGEVKTPLGFNQAAPAQGVGAPVLVLRKTPCLGFCPHFEASIYLDGRVHYVGYSHVAKVGTYELQLPAEAVREMMQRADEAGFGNFRDKYVSGATDMPSTYLTYNRPGQPGKTVQVEEGAPAELMALLNYVGNVVDGVSGGVNPDR